MCVKGPGRVTDHPVCTMTAGQSNNDDFSYQQLISVSDTRFMTIRRERERESGWGGGGGGGGGDTHTETQ